MSSWKAQNFFYFPGSKLKLLATVALPKHSFHLTKLENPDLNHWIC